MYLKKDFLTAYIRYRSQAIILEEIAQNGPILRNTELKRLIFSMYQSDKYLSEHIGMEELYKATGALINIGLLKVIDQQKIGLTDEGVKALRSGTFQSLAHNAFHNYTHFLSQRQQLMLSMIALILSILSLLTSVGLIQW